MTYRAIPSRCFICQNERVLGQCERCNGPLCLEHLHVSDRRCERCELDWVAPLRGMRVVGPKLMVLFIFALCVALFITFSAASVNYWTPEIERVKWVGGAVSLGIIVLLAAAMLLPALRMEHIRRRFLREQLDRTLRLRVRIAPEPTADVRLELDAEAELEAAAEHRGEMRTAS